ncbi:MAG: Ycf66 family protein [Microcoleus sp.]|uniref:Ycf66 family protein n=1 Tax=Microcoleus sp. TaxID=44472 RepID=UPI003C76AFF9
MLAYILALAVGLGSFSIYMAAFFFPEVHRKSDFTWSGVGLFYALILWACAGRITGALLLGQMAGVAMLGWFAWETLTLRRLVTPVAQQTPIPKSPNLTGAAGGPLSGLFGKKSEPAAKKPKFVRSPKPKTDVVPAPAANESPVKLEEQPATPPIAETIGESPIGPDLTIPEEKAPAIAEIPVFPVETPAAETSPDPAESASSFTPLPPPIEFSEIAAPATVEPAEAQPQPQQQPETDDFEEIWRAKAKESEPAAPTAAPTTAPTAAPTAAPTGKSTPAKAANKSGGFGSLFDNIKNSLGGILGLGGGKSKSEAKTPATTEKKTPEPIAPESKTTAIPAPDIDRILESELAEAASEAAAETSNTAVETSQAVPFPTDVETMADLMAAPTASSATIEESSIGDRDPSADSQTPPAAVGETEAAANVPEAQAPEPSLEMTVVEMIAVAPVEIPESGQPDEMSGVEVVSVTVVSIESTEKQPSSEEEPAELIRPTPPTSEIVETAQPAAESKSENLSDEGKPPA